MFQGSKKKTNLSTKSSGPSSKVPVKGQPKKKNLNDLSSSFVSCFSLSSQTAGKLDDSLFSLDNSNSKNVPSVDENESDDFAFPNKKNCSSSRSVFANKTILNSQIKKKADTFDQTNLNCSSVSKLGIDLNKEVKTNFNDSSMIFKFKKENKEDEMVNKIPSSIEIFEVENNVKEEHSSDDDVPISDLREKTNSSSPQSRTDSQPSSISEPVNHCPICLKTISNLKYVGHMKTCAAKNKLSTQQLLSALELHKKQRAERKELGLDLPQQSFRAKVSPKRSKVNDKKVAGDSNLQLALALSASLRSAEEADLIQEAEVLQQAGLGAEADQRLSTLEKFGFASSLPILPSTSSGNSKSRSTAPTLLLRRTKEERERIVTEKVAIVLISEEENVVLDSLTEKDFNLKSKLLRKVWDKETRLWGMAHCPSKEERATFYVTTLSNFVSPTKAEVGQGLRRLSQLPGRLNTPVKEDISELQTSPRLFNHESEVSELPSSPNLAEEEGTGTECSYTTNQAVCGKSITPNKTNKLSLDWSTLVGNPVMSDVEVKCEGNSSVPAHKLVFHVRCPSVLNEIVKDDMEKDIIIWEHCSKCSVVAFLDYVYSESSKKILNSSPKDLRSVSELADRFDFSELKSLLRTLNFSTCSSKKATGNNVETKRQLFVGIAENKSDIQNNQEKNCFSRDSNGILNYDHANGSQISDGRVSPDMFNESSVMENDTDCQGNNDDLDILASLVGKTTTTSASFSSKIYKTNELDEESPFEFNESDSRKRKKLSTGLSDDEDVSLSKKLCPDSSSQAEPSQKNKDEVFDLTQSSNSSNEELVAGIKAKSFEDVHLNETCCNDSNEEMSMSDLTQTKSCLYFPKEIASSLSENCEVKNDSRSEDYAAPVWDCFDDDYLHFNYDTPAKLSEKSFAEKSTIEKRSTEKCFQNLTPSSVNSPQVINYISSESKSPKLIRHTLITSSPSPKNKSSFKYTISPVTYSQRTLDNLVSPKHSSDEKKHNSFDHESNVELIQDNGSPDLNECEKSKTRKNLNKQFDLTGSSPEQNGSPLLKSRRTSKIIIKPSESTKEKVEKRLSKKDSLAAMQRLLDDSLEISDTVFATADALLATETAVKEDRSKLEQKNTKNPSTSRQGKYSNNSCEKVVSVMTPCSEIFVSDNVTPLLDYSAMKTPSLKKELSRFGLKPSLGRRKAKLLLRYIYDQTHPLVVDPAGRETVLFKQPLQSPVKSPCKKQSTVDLEDSASEEEESCSQRSTSSSISSSATVPEESFCEMEDILSQDLSNTGDIKTSIRSLIFSNPELHRKILLYDPIHLEELMAMLKTNGIKSKTNFVMDFLDEQCITFRTSSWKATNEKRRLKQKSPKKKSKITNSSDTSEVLGIPNSPMKALTQTNIVKKRGRPRKTDNNS